jgi:hypothetical protein
MAAVAYAVAVTVTLLSFSPGAGLCIQMPDIEPFWLLYPDSLPPHPGLLSAGFPPKTPDPLPEPLPDPLPDPLPEPLPEPVPEPGLVVLTELLFEAEPQPAMIRTWSAIATEQTTERQSFNMWHPQPNGCGLPGFVCPARQNISLEDRTVDR